METKTLVGQDIVIPRPDGTEVEGLVVDVVNSNNLAGMYVTLVDLQNPFDSLKPYIVSFGLYSKLLTSYGKDKPEI